MAKTVRLSPDVQGPLKGLVQAIKEDYGLAATQESVVAAMVHEVTVGQAAGMLMAYTKHRAATEQDDDSDG